MLERGKDKITFSKNHFEIDAKVYNSLAEMPEEYQEMFKDADGNNIPDIIDQALDEDLPEFAKRPLKKLLGSILPRVEQQVAKENQQKITQSPLAKSDPVIPQLAERSEKGRIILFLVLVGIVIFVLYKYSGWF